MGAKSYAWVRISGQKCFLVGRQWVGADKKLAEFLSMQFQPTQPWGEAIAIAVQRIVKEFKLMDGEWWVSETGEPGVDAVY